MGHIQRRGAVSTIVLAPLIAGCTAPQGAPPGAGYAPYDEQTNPFCGALGTCAPSSTTPLPDAAEQRLMRTRCSRAATLLILLLLLARAGCAPPGPPFASVAAGIPPVPPGMARVLSLSLARTL